jgi:futalosine hydrolase
MNTPRPAGGDGALLLFPTELERRGFLGDREGLSARSHVIGFGPVSAAARTASLIARLAPPRVILLGIAGSFDTTRRPIESCWTFSSVILDGVGAGEGEGFLARSALGIPQWPSAADAPPIQRAASSPPIEDRLALAPHAELPDAGLLLTVCAASASAAQARRRSERFDGVAAEDMEGFAVALACAQAGVACSIVRAISNAAGDRDHGKWSVAAALSALGRALEP